MKILYTINSGNPGGVEQYILDLVLGLVKKNHQVFVVCKPGPIVNWYKDAGANVFLQNINFEFDPFYIFNLAKFLRKNEIDVVHVNELKSGINGVLAAKIAGTKNIVSHIHTPMSEWQTPNFLKKVYTKIEIFFYAFFVNLFSDYEIALTESRKKIKIKEGIKEEKIKVIPNGIDIEKFDVASETRGAYRRELFERYNIPQNALIFGNVGRHTEEKGHKYLLEAFSLFIREHSEADNIYMILAGGGRLTEELRQQSKDLGVDNRTIITGVFESHDQLKYYSTFDFFIFPSVAEGFGLVLAEAMLQKIPVIASDLEVLREVGGDSVIYFKNRNSVDLKEKMLQVTKLSPAEKQIIGDKLYNRVTQNFGLEKFVDNYELLYSSLLASKNK